MISPAWSYCCSASRVWRAVRRFLAFWRCFGVFVPSMAAGAAFAFYRVAALLQVPRIGLLLLGLVGPCVRPWLRLLSFCFQCALNKPAAGLLIGCRSSPGLVCLAAGCARFPVAFRRSRCVPLFFTACGARAGFRPFWGRSWRRAVFFCWLWLLLLLRASSRRCRCFLSWLALPVSARLPGLGAVPGLTRGKIAAAGYGPAPVLQVFRFRLSWLQ